MSALKKIMNDEIKKYQGRIYFLDIEKDIYGNLKKPRIERADWIFDTKCYDHYSFELHHVIKFGHWEHNKSRYLKEGLKMCLILLPKVMHQHLENPEFELSDDDFYRKYLIHKHELLFIKSKYDEGKYPAMLKSVDCDELFGDDFFNFPVDTPCLA